MNKIHTHIKEPNTVRMYHVHFQFLTYLTNVFVDPPEMPTISGYTEGREVYAENILSMTFTCVGANPSATLPWWKGNNKEVIKYKKKKVVAT